MAGIATRLGIGLALAFVALTLVGVGAAWYAWRRGSDPVALGVAAYAEGDWTRAADLARRRLRAAREDAAALRLLARATARLGRDAEANALFARLGSDALQAEDLLLLGKGLDRAGRKEDAGRIWEKSIRIQPDHAETLEQLVIRDTAQNRLAEAAELAGRLARQPGWEFRGELNLGALRAELNDPAGAAAVLRRALERPEAARLDRPADSRYRNLLARSLLRTGRTRQAHSVLTGLLERGSDPEASWLLSRAELLEGSIPEARAAFEAAGSYRAEHPLEAEPGPFVGEARCAECHPDAFRAARASRHARTLMRGKPLLELAHPSDPIPDPDDPEVRHAFRTEQGRLRFETRVKDQVLGAVVDYAFGSPDRYMSLVGRDDRGRGYVLRLSRFQSGRESGWVRTTGHTAETESGQNFLGKPLDPLDGVQRCLFCHTTNFRAVLDGTGPESKDRAIGCERCHGPGAVHEKAVAARFRDLAIVRPSEASAEGRIRLCGQCHSLHQELSLPRTDPFWIRFQGTTLPWSRCYTESDGAFDCMTCHDPHHDSDRSEARYDGRCLDCHAAAPPAGPTRSKSGGARGSACPVDSTTGCVGCHMPRTRVAALHTTFTDHFIRVHPQKAANPSGPPSTPNGAQGSRPAGTNPRSPGR
jgi:tetratricopeptide (TPR) repeat protein